MISCQVVGGSGPQNSSCGLAIAPFPSLYFLLLNSRGKKEKKINKFRVYVCFGFWWWARLPLPEKGRWVGRRVRRVNLERALSRSSARVCAQMNAYRKVGWGRGGATARVGGFGLWHSLCPGPVQSSTAPILCSALVHHFIPTNKRNSFVFLFFLSFFLPFATWIYIQCDSPMEYLQRGMWVTRLGMLE